MKKISIFWKKVLTFFWKNLKNGGKLTFLLNRLCYTIFTHLKLSNYTIFTQICFIKSVFVLVFKKITLNRGFTLYLLTLNRGSTVVEWSSGVVEWCSWVVRAPLGLWFQLGSGSGSDRVWVALRFELRSGSGSARVQAPLGFGLRTGSGSARVRTSLGVFELWYKSQF